MHALLRLCGYTTRCRQAYHCTLPHCRMQPPTLEPPRPALLLRCPGSAQWLALGAKVVENVVPCVLRLLRVASRNTAYVLKKPRAPAVFLRMLSPLPASGEIVFELCGVQSTPTFYHFPVRGQPPKLFLRSHPKNRLDPPVISVGQVGCIQVTSYQTSSFAAEPLGPPAGPQGVQLDGSPPARAERGAVDRDLSTQNPHHWLCLVVQTTLCAGLPHREWLGYYLGLSTKLTIAF